MNEESVRKNLISSRFRGYLPVVVDVETGGFDAKNDALLEIAAVILDVNDDGSWFLDETVTRYINPFEGANLDKAAMEFTGIDPDHPFRKQIAVSEKTGLQEIFQVIRTRMKKHDCKRSILVGHNAAFDISFLNAAVIRTNIKRNPFHPFSTFDTVTLGGLAYGQTVLARAVEAAGIAWDSTQAHSARYDAEKTAELFCAVVNRWQMEQ
ncbi:MAG: ribonuclease T [Gammaproteobacteria bacterium]|jgi:ribonuclease T